MDTAETKGETNGESWMSDVQRALALMLIGTVTIMILVFTFRIAWSGDLQTVGALLKELKDALTNMSLIALGFFFGSTMSKRLADAGQQRLVERLSTQPNGTGGGMAAPAVVATATVAAVEAAKAVAPAAAAEAAPAAAAAAAAAPPAAADAAPPAVDAELDRRGLIDPKPKE